MQLLPTLSSDLEGLLVYAGMLLVWAQALFVSTRGGRAPVPILATLAMAAFSVYLLGLWAGALAFPDAPERWVAWLRWTWWGATLATAFWLALILALAVEEGGPRFNVWPGPGQLPATALPIAVGIVFSLLGVGSEAILRWSEAFPAPAPITFGANPVTWHLPPGPLYGIYEVYLLLTLGLPVAVLALLMRTTPAGGPLRARFRGLLACAVIFLLGGAYIGVATAVFHASAVPGEMLLVGGMVLMGWNIARYGALLSGEFVAADLRAFIIATVALVGLYTGLVLLVPAEHAWAEGARLLILAVLTTHALADRSSAMLDQVLFEPAASALRRRLRFLADRAVRQPDSITALVEVREELEAVDSGALPARGQEQELRLLVEGGLRHLNDLPGLSQHVLVGSTPSTLGVDLTPMEAAARLRSDLVEAIERLRPNTPRPTPGGSAGPGGWLHYLVLYEAYVDGRPNKHIMQRYYLSESTFHRARRRAVDAIAADLHQRLLRKVAFASVRY
ncbi:MAG: hypothetical protein LC797_20245 [Chloroflexi bacterium]|nr:hypothetical protein [Chloroflexota bacterium]